MAPKAGLMLVAQFAASFLALEIGLSAEAAAQRRPAPVEFAAAAPAAERPPHTQVAALAPSSTRRVSIRYPDQPDVDYGYGGGDRAGQGDAIDLRPRPAARATASATPPAGAPRAFDPQRAVAAATLDPAPPRANAVGINPAPVAAPRARPDWLERERVGAPYEAKGKVFVPTPEPGYEQSGMAGVYAEGFAGRRTASGESHDPLTLSGAHPTLPIPSLVQVTNLETGREAIVRINDRGPFQGDGLIQLSNQAARTLGVSSNGARVHVRYLGPAPRRVQSADGATAARSAPPSNAATPSSGFVVQVGAFSAEANAMRVRDSLRAEGVVTIEPRQTAGGRLYRVRVGPWPTRAEAEAALGGVAQKGFPAAIVTALN